MLFCKKKPHSKSSNKFSETDISNILEILIGNIFIMFRGRVVQQIVGIHMCTSRAPVFDGLFLYSHESDLIKGFLKKTKRCRQADPVISHSAL